MFFFVNVQVFTSAAVDDTKSTVLVAFGTMERIVRDYFRYMEINNLIHGNKQSGALNDWTLLAMQHHLFDDLV